MFLVRSLSGMGLGWRPETAQMVASHPGLTFTEVIAESVCPQAIQPALSRLVEGGTPVIPHGVTLSLGSAEGLDQERLDSLARVAEALDAPFVSEHVALVRAGGREAGHLLPLPRTRQQLDILLENIELAQLFLPVPLVLENIAMLVEWPENEMSEGEFLGAMLAESTVDLLLDLANLYANHLNYGWDLAETARALPWHRIAYAHVAGGMWKRGLYHDTHGHSVPHEVLELVAELCRPNNVPVLLERDKNYGDRKTMEAELAALAGALEIGEVRRVA